MLISDAASPAVGGEVCGGRVSPGAVILQAEYTFSVLSLVTNKHQQQQNPPIRIHPLIAQYCNKQTSKHPPGSTHLISGRNCGKAEGVEMLSYKW